jgi:3-methyladenine DNA glycosylase AlkD
VPIEPGRATREIASSLRAVGNQERATQEKRYLKSELVHLGTNVPTVRRVVKRFAAGHPDLTREELLELVEALWAEPVHERRLAAVELLHLYGPLLEPADVSLLERLIRESKTWALVDGLAVNIAGRLVERFPELGTALDRWAHDEDFWLRRSALLAHLVPLRSGEGDFMRFGRYADAMLDEREFFVRKAIGWVLRETGKNRPELVYAWLRPRAERAAGLTIREAVKYLPRSEREGLLALHRDEGRVSRRP